MTTRQRRIARVERLNGWAEGREAKADAASEQARAKAEMIPFGQPILAGHHSEKRDTNYRAGIARGFDRAHDHQAKADDMRSRAANISAAVESSIYSDDEDATERLQAKIARLEAERQRITDYNKSCRKGAGDESILDERQQATLASLRRVASFQLQANGALPAYATSNLSATINTAKKRLASLTAV